MNERNKMVFSYPRLISIGIYNTYTYVSVYVYVCMYVCVCVCRLV